MSVSIEGGRAGRAKCNRKVVSGTSSSNWNGKDTCTFTLHIAAVDGQFRYVTKFLGTLRNSMSVSIGGGRAEQNALGKFYQVQVAATAMTMTLAHSHFT